MNKFKLKSKFKLSGDQPQAVDKLIKGLEKGEKFQTLLGVTGSGKTFTVANVIEEVQKPTLVIAPNKTLAAQLASEFRDFFPKNAVEYFVSYYDYYQPESYLPTTDTYIEKEADINEEIDRMRHSATTSLLSRNDVIIVSSVSCIYGLGSPKNYKEGSLVFKVGQKIQKSDILMNLVDAQFERSNYLEKGKFRWKGNVLEIMPTARRDFYRLEMIGDKVKKILKLDFLTRKVLAEPEEIEIYPAKHFIIDEEEKELFLGEIEKELEERVEYFKKNNKFLEAERIEHRTRQDLALLHEVGYCRGIENYSRHLTQRGAGEPPDTLLDYFPKDFLLIVDESHVTTPQIKGMYEGDHARKKNLIDYGFRLPSALDNRPLKNEEFWKKIKQTIFVSATPGKIERKKSKDMVEQVIRPTGLVDPKLYVLPCDDQVKEAINQIKKLKYLDKILITTLTKKTAEQLSEYLQKNGIKAKYLHSEIKTIERVQILNDLRRGKFQCLVGVNLLREGLDLPEVSLVMILDADKEGFLRSETSLIQTIGRAARNVDGKVILFANEMTGSLKNAISETERRREKQNKYNKEHGIEPQTIKKKIRAIIREEEEKKEKAMEEFEELIELDKLPEYIATKEKEMKLAAENLEFETAATIRDEINKLKRHL